MPNVDQETEWRTYRWYDFGDLAYVDCTSGWRTFPDRNTGWYEFAGGEDDTKQTADKKILSGAEPGLHGEMEDALAKAGAPSAADEGRAGTPRTEVRICNGRPIFSTTSWRRCFAGAWSPCS